jgi:hypothetical protein
MLLYRIGSVVIQRQQMPPLRGPLGGGTTVFPTIDGSDHCATHSQLKALLELMSCIN